VLRVVPCVSFQATCVLQVSSILEFCKVVYYEHLMFVLSELLLSIIPPVQRLFIEFSGSK